MNHRGERIFLVALHAVPHLGHPGAGGINDVAATLIEQLHLLHRGTKGRQDHHIAALHSGEILDALFHGDEQHVHLNQMGVHRGVVDDLVGDPDALSGVMAAGLIGNGHRALHPPAETKGFGQANRDAPLAQLIAVLTDVLDQLALVGLLKASGHLVGTAKTAAVVTLGMMQRSLEGAGVHGRAKTAPRRPIYGLIPDKKKAPASAGAMR